MQLRDLERIDEFQQVVELEREIWGVGYQDVVPVPMFVISVKRGGILIGGFADDGTMVGFVYSLPGLRRGVPMQWSHMLGVLDPYRNSGLGRELKLAQRRRTIELGLDLVEWTYDPLQALNAHLNFRRLGVVVEEYAVNVYGESTSPLHGSTPTDRFIAAWYVREPHVERRIQPGPAGEARSDAALEPINRLTRQGDWLACADDFAVPAGAERFAVEIPVGYTEMLRDAPALADDWRLKIRRIFTESFERGYRVVDFLLDRPAGRGRYVVAPVPSESPRSTGRSG